MEANKPIHASITRTEVDEPVEQKVARDGNRRILRYLVSVQDVTKIKVHQYSDVIYVGEHSGKVCICVESEINRPLIEMNIYIIGCGHPMPQVATIYLGTAPMEQGKIPLHIYADNEGTFKNIDGTPS